jgi:hypothetical protein
MRFTEQFNILVSFYLLFLTLSIFLFSWYNKLYIKTSLSMYTKKNIITLLLLEVFIERVIYFTVKSGLNKYFEKIV